ncbi:metallophosphoesterase [candidate division KSB1 bacterium]|nr:MAG: metallophosphoesterase [candidate division KSB1 bacterium]
MSIKRAFALAALFISFLLFRCSDSGNSFTFAFMTDIHLQPERNAEQGFAAAIERVNQIAPDFVITGGDLIMDALGQSHERATLLYGMYGELARVFAMPVYNTIGNHEVFGLYEESGVSPLHAEYGKAMYLKNMGYEKPYYSFDHKNWHFISMDGIGLAPGRYYGHVDSLQLIWLENDLRAVDPATPIVVSTHIPLVTAYGQFRHGATYSLGRGEIIVNAAEVLHKFANHNLKLVLQGHHHIVEHIHFRDTHYISGGAVCGAWWQGPRDGFAEGFLIIDVKKDDVSWRYETFGWIAENETGSE